MEDELALRQGQIEKEDGQEDNGGKVRWLSYSIKLHGIRKLEVHAATDHKIPMFMVQFLGDVFFIMRPEHVEGVWKHMNRGKSSEVKSEPLDNIVEIQEVQVSNRKMIKSGNKSKYNKMIEKERQIRDDKFKADRRAKKEAYSNETYFIKYNKKTEEGYKKKYREYVEFADNDKMIFEIVQEFSYKESFSISDYISRHISILTKEDYKTEAKDCFGKKSKKVINE